MKRLCMGCMETYEDTFDICPFCGYIHGEPAREAYHITPGSMLTNRYVIGRVLGFGGFGITYIGYDKLLEHKVAIKEYMPSEFSTRMPGQQQVTIYSGEREEQYLEGLKKILDEAKRLAQFQSEPGIVHIYDCFEENSTAYIVMEYLDGESLKAKLSRDGKMAVEEAMPIVMAVLSALKKVHEVGIIHRDIAPDNIYLLNDGEVKLLDFGAARYATTKHSKSLSVIIKPGYAPEEQYRSRGDQGPWTDVYALAATFYKMLTGITPEDAMERSIKDEVKKLSKLGVKIDKSVETAIMNAMNIKIENRTPSAADFEAELLAAEVKEIAVKNEKEDVGKVAPWIKIAVGAVGVVIVVFMALLLTGTIHFNIAGFGGRQITEGQARVPNVINVERAKAKKKIGTADLVMQVSQYTSSSEIPADRVLDQSIKGGNLIDAGGIVSVVLSSGKETTHVPDVVGLTREEAQKLFDEASLIPEFKEKKFKAAPGTIAEQDKAADEQVEVGSKVTLTVSMGFGEGDSSAQAQVKDVVGIGYEEASELLYENHLYLLKESSVYSDEIPEGQIISQTPAAGQTVSEESNVSVVVSLGKEKVYVPQMLFTSQEEAENLLIANALAADIQQEYSIDVPLGNITQQSIKDGTSVEKGTVITITVSMGPEPQTPVETTARPPAQTKAPESKPVKAPVQTHPAAPAPTQPAQPTEAPTPAPTPAPTQAPTQPPDSGEKNIDDISDIMDGLGL